MVDCNFEQISVFTLQDEKESALSNGQHLSNSSSKTTNLHFVHDRSSDDNTAIRVFQRVFPTRYRYPVLRYVHMAVDYMVFAANQYTRRPIKPIRASILATRHLDEQVRPRVSRLAPLAHDVV